MQSREALAAALGMRSHPRLVRKARRVALPKGVTFLLEVAAGDGEALREAVALTDHPQAILQEAAGFFIEQILLSQNADNYRTLGASRQASHAELRRHMALLMRWLHPDVISGGASGPCLDRSIYVNRVTKAWESVKTDERRAEYNSSLQPVMIGQGKVGSGQKPMAALVAIQNGARKQVSASPSRRRSLWSSFLMILGGRR